jgi:hypothetical protein
MQSKNAVSSIDYTTVTALDRTLWCQEAVPPYWNTALQCTSETCNRPVPCILHTPSGVKVRPTDAELESPLFNAIWEAIKGWDISRESDGVYAGATGTDVCTIMDAVRGTSKLVLRCHGCRGTLIYKRLKNGEIEVFHNFCGKAGTPETPDLRPEERYDGFTLTNLIKRECPDGITGTPETPEICENCHQAYGVWFVANEFWNLIIPERTGMLCPNCFIARAERVAIKVTGWQLVPENFAPASTPEGDTDRA